MILRPTVSKFESQGMDKTGANQTTANGTQLTNFITRPGFPAIIVADRLVVNKDGTKLIRFGVKALSSNGAAPFSLMVNSTSVATLNVGSLVSTPVTNSVSVALNVNDTVWLRTNSATFYKTVVGDSDTFIWWS